MLTTIVVDHLNRCFLDDPDVGLAYLYCNFRRHDEQRIEDLMANLLKELFALQSRTGVNFFATSRLVPDIVKVFEDVPSLEIRASREDIERYLKGQMDVL